MYFKDIDTAVNMLEIKLVDADSGFNTIPFTINNNGRITVTSGLDFESRDEYFLKVIVKDMAENEVEELVFIKIIDIPDLPPKFIQPSKENEEFTFIENTIGHITNLQVESRNAKPLGDFAYEILSVKPQRYMENLVIRYKPENQSWFLDCKKKIELGQDGSDQLIELKIKAFEFQRFEDENKLKTELNLNLKIVSGDVCG